MNVSLTQELEKRIEEKVKSGLYQTASEVVREAMRQFFEAEEKKRQPSFSVNSQEHLEQKLFEGLASGPAKEMKRRDWSRIRHRVATRLKKQR